MTCGGHSVLWTQFLVVCESVAACDRALLPGHESHLKETSKYIQYLSSAYLHHSTSRSRVEAIPGMEQVMDLLNLVIGLRKNETSKERDKIFGFGGAQWTLRRHRSIFEPPTGGEHLAAHVWRSTYMKDLESSDVHLLQ